MWKRSNPTCLAGCPVRGSGIPYVQPEVVHPRFWRVGSALITRAPQRVPGITKPYKFIGFGAMDITKPYKFIGFGAMDITKPYKFIGFGAT